jgi:hypothetical protein
MRGADVMIDEVARWFVFAFGLWLIALSLFMLLRPRNALVLLAKMGSTKVIHYSELGLRFMAGVSMILAAPASHAPEYLTPIGWFVAASSVVLMLLPRSWHAAYSSWWAQRIPPFAVSALAPLSICAGALLAHSVM